MSALQSTFGSFAIRDFRYFWTVLLISSLALTLAYVLMPVALHDAAGGDSWWSLSGFYVAQGSAVIVFGLFAAVAADRFRQEAAHADRADWYSDHADTARSADRCRADHVGCDRRDRRVSRSRHLSVANRARRLGRGVGPEAADRERRRTAGRAAAGPGLDWVRDRDGDAGRPGYRSRLGVRDSRGAPAGRCPGGVAVALDRAGGAVRRSTADSARVRRRVPLRGADATPAGALSVWNRVWQWLCRCDARIQRRAGRVRSAGDQLVADRRGSLRSSPPCW